jgi:hypothetical protein
MGFQRMAYPTGWENNPSIENQNIDVLVRLEDGYSYTYVLVIATAENLEYLMDQKNANCFRPGHPFVIVREFTQEIIREAVKAYVEENDGYWLKFYHFAGEIDVTVFDELEAKAIKEEKDK